MRNSTFSTGTPDAARRTGTLWCGPVVSNRGRPDGHYRASAGIEDHIVYVAMLEDGSQVTLTPKAFAERFGWKNGPAKAQLMELGE